MQHLEGEDEKWDEGVQAARIYSDRVIKNGHQSTGEGTVEFLTGHQGFEGIYFYIFTVLFFKKEAFHIWMQFLTHNPNQKVVVILRKA